MLGDSVVLQTIWWQLNFINIIQDKGVIAKSKKLDDKLNMLRYTLITLFLSVIWLMFNPIWFPQAKLKYDFMRFFLLAVAFLAIIVTYRNYKRILQRK